MNAVTMTLMPLTLLILLKGLSRRIALIAPTFAPIPSRPSILYVKVERWKVMVLPGDNDDKVKLVPGVVEVGIGP